MCEPMNPAPPVTRYNPFSPTLVFPSFSLGSVGNDAKVNPFQISISIFHMKARVIKYARVINPSTFQSHSFDPNRPQHQRHRLRVYSVLLGQNSG